MRKPLFLIMFAVGVNAVAIIPPVAYFITVSLATFLANAFIALIAWIAIQGFSQKMYAGKTVHEIASFIFSSLAKTLLAISSMLAAMVFFQPIDVNTAIITGLASGAIAFSLFFLASYRQNSIEGNKNFDSILLASTLIIVITSAAGFLAIETKLVYKEPQFVESSEALSLPNFDLGEQKAMSIAGTPLNVPMQEKQTQTKPTKLVEQLWFFPQDSQECIIASNGVEIARIKPENNCYYPENGQLKKIFCPISLKPSQIATTEATISSTGSCNQKYLVKTEDNSFEVE